jgi:hypothetical protein
MRPKPAEPDAGTSVIIVSNNPETLDGLKAYLEQAGIASRSMRRIRDLGKVAPSSVAAIVIFPDDFQDEDVLPLLDKLGRARPRLLTLVVTRDPKRFRPGTPERAALRILLPKPPFGWEIVDALRAHGVPEGTR